jgi:vacuolar protein sorting-associated protein 1
MAIVTERINASKPPPPVDNPKTGKLAPGTVNNNKDLDVDAKKEEPSFFGSFFSGNKNQPKKKGAAVMEAVGGFISYDCCHYNNLRRTSPLL